MIEDAKNDSSQNDSHLHLVGVGVEQLVLCHTPDLQNGNGNEPDKFHTI